MAPHVLRCLLSQPSMGEAEQGVGGSQAQQLPVGSDSPLRVPPGSFLPKRKQKSLTAQPPRAGRWCPRCPLLGLPGVSLGVPDSGRQGHTQAWGRTQPHFPGLCSSASCEPGAMGQQRKHRGAPRARGLSVRWQVCQEPVTGSQPLPEVLPDVAVPSPHTSPPGGTAGGHGMPPTGWIPGSPPVVSTCLDLVGARLGCSR